MELKKINRILDYEQELFGFCDMHHRNALVKREDKQNKLIINPGIQGFWVGNFTQSIEKVNIFLGDQFDQIKVPKKHKTVELEKGELHVPSGSLAIVSSEQLLSSENKKKSKQIKVEPGNYHYTLFHWKEDLSPKDILRKKAKAAIINKRSKRIAWIDRAAYLLYFYVAYKAAPTFFDTFAQWLTSGYILILFIFSILFGFYILNNLLCLIQERFFPFKAKSEEVKIWEEKINSDPKLLKSINLKDDHRLYAINLFLEKII